MMMSHAPFCCCVALQGHEQVPAMLLLPLQCRQAVLIAALAVEVAW